ncbi:MAG: type II toxin-antitoxin system RelE/ParE family toxin [Alphaproteobacteria bacterium]
MSDDSWKIIFVPEAEKEFFKLDHQIQRQIQQYLRKKITTTLNPRRFGKQLGGNLSGIWRYRVGSYRLLCSIKDKECIVLVVHVGHRRDVYQ